MMSAARLLLGMSFAARLDVLGDSSDAMRLLLAEILLVPELLVWRALKPALVHAHA